MKLKYILAGLILSSASVASAQLTGNVSVEGEYAPIVIETERLNSYPKTYRFELPAANVEYDFTGIVTDFKPSLLSMGVTGRLTDWPWRKRNGFVDFRMGSWLDTRLDAGWAIRSDTRQSLNASLQFNSSSLYRMSGVPESFTLPSHKKLYDGQIGLQYYRLFNREGILKAEFDYRLAYFNYYGTTVPHQLAPSGITVPTQTMNRINAGISYKSTPSQISGWHAEAGVSYLGYRRLYGPVMTGEKMRGDKETHINAEGGYNFNFGDINAIAVDAGGDFLFYSKPQDVIASMGVTSKSRNYGIVSLKPSYRLAKDNLSLLAGVDLTVGYDAMGYEPDDAKFYISPDIKFEYNFPSGVGLSLSATGGVTPTTLAMREKFDRYQMPYILWTKPIYSPVDARMGVNIGPFSGFSSSFGFRYAIARNTPVGGWYQQLLGSFPSTGDRFMNYITTPNRQAVNLSGFSVDLGVKYCFGNLVEAEFKGSYTPQSAEDGIFNGFDRPRWTLSAKAGANPIKKLNIELGYDYRGVRNCYAWGPQLYPGIEPPLEAYRLPDITDLNAKVTYSLLDNLDIYCKGENLLNRRVDLLPGLQSEGILIQGGIYWEF